MIVPPATVTSKVAPVPVPPVVVVVATPVYVPLDTRSVGFVVIEELATTVTLNVAPDPDPPVVGRAKYVLPVIRSSGFVVIAEVVVVPDEPPRSPCAIVRTSLVL